MTDSKAKSSLVILLFRSYEYLHTPKFVKTAAVAIFVTTHLCSTDGFGFKGALNHPSQLGKLVHG